MRAWPRLQYRVGDGAWTTYAAPVALPAGSYDVDYRAQGTNLQWSETQTLRSRSTTCSRRRGAARGRTVTVTATDADSGSAPVEYRLDGGGWLTYTGPVSVDGRRTRSTPGHRRRRQHRRGGQLDVAAEPDPDPSPSATALPEVTGDPRVGSRLTATPGTWDQDGLTFSYQWLSDGVVVPGARTGQYVVRGNDVGRRISVQVTASRGDVAPGVAESAATAPVRKAGAKVTAKAGDTTPKAGQRVKVAAKVGTTPGGVPVTGRVQVLVDGWQVGTARVVGGTASTTLRLHGTGRHRVVLSYPGSATVGAAKDAVVVRTHR